MMNSSPNCHCKSTSTHAWGKLQQSSRIKFDSKWAKLHICALRLEVRSFRLGRSWGKKRGKKTIVQAPTMSCGSTSAVRRRTRTSVTLLAVSCGSASVLVFSVPKAISLVMVPYTEASSSPTDFSSNNLYYLAENNPRDRNCCFQIKYWPNNTNHSQCAGLPSYLALKLRQSLTLIFFT